MARDRRRPPEEGPIHSYEVILGMPTLRKVSPRAEAVLEVVEEKPVGGIGGDVPRDRDAPLAGGGGVSAKNLEGIVEAIHELERFRVTTESDLKSLRDKSDRMLTTISSMDDVRRSLYALELRMQEVAALFDVLSLDINPFIDQPGGSPSKAQRDEPFVSEIWTLKWLEFLQERMSGYDIPNLLEYYKEIGWIDDMIESRAMTYLKSLRFDVRPVDKAVTGEGDIIPLDREESDGWKLRSEDTISSYLFIQRIKGVRVDPTVIDDIEEEVKRLLEMSPMDILANVAFPDVAEPEVGPGFSNGNGEFTDSPFEEVASPPPETPAEGEGDPNAFMEVPVIDEEELDRLKEKLDHLSSGEEG